MVSISRLKRSLNEDDNSDQSWRPCHGRCATYSHGVMVLEHMLLVAHHVATADGRLELL